MGTVTLARLSAFGSTAAIDRDGVRCNSVAIGPKADIGGVSYSSFQYPAPQRYCHAIPKMLNSLPVRVEMPVLALSLIEL
jgi:hypothetical protein